MTKKQQSSISLTERQFLALIKLGTGGAMDDCLIADTIDWPALYAMAKKQSLVGLTFAGIERLPKDRIPDMDLLMTWLGLAESIKAQNANVNAGIKQLKEKGLKDYVVLKGQGLAELYPQPELRTSGDIDALIGDCRPTDELIRNTILMALKNGGMAEKAFYHHCDFGKSGGIAVEAHWRASWFYCPLYNARFQRFCIEHLRNEKSVQDANAIPTPSLAFNRVYVLVHIYRHLFGEGIGLRQLIDYYMVLQASAKSASWQQEKEETMQMLKRLGMKRFTAGIMYILQNALGLDEECLLCPPDKQAGDFLLTEIMEGGNFGHYDKRYARNADDSFFRYAIRKYAKIIPMFRFGPRELLWAPVWRLWHVGYWMKKYNQD